MKSVTLTVIVPDNRAGMQRMLQRELLDIDAQVIFDEWRSGLEQARGDFVCLLEADSGISEGSVFRQLREFIDNPSYRKLAMVSPYIEFDNTDVMPLVYRLDAKNKASEMQDPYQTRVGCVPGAIIRRRSLIKYLDSYTEDIVEMSKLISISFWENGLRVMNDPRGTYYSPSKLEQDFWLEPSPKLSELWKRELIL